MLSLTFVLATLGILPSPVIMVEWKNASREDSTQYMPSFTRPLERELVLVYFGSATCGWSNHPDLPGIIDSAKVMVRGHAAELGASFSTMGIAINWDTKDGVKHLDKIGRFDDIITGRGDSGIGARTYRDILVGTPQVSVLERTALNLQGGVPTQFEEKELIRYTSQSRIVNWIRRGAPVPMGTN